MSSARTAELINDFLGSTQVFASSVNDVIEKRLLRGWRRHRFVMSATC